MNNSLLLVMNYLIICLELIKNTLLPIIKKISFFLRLKILLEIKINLINLLNIIIMLKEIHLIQLY